MKVLILGSSGILGQSLKITPHPSITAVYHTGRAACDLTDYDARGELLDRVNPDVIVNLAGESRPDCVEQNSALYRIINIKMPRALGVWAINSGRHYVHISSQSVFSGTTGATYGCNSYQSPINQYGVQKRDAERELTSLSSARVTIIRPTFVLGIRPDPTVGRANPVELMLGGQKQQVNDRWFSPSFAPDVASLIWDVCGRKPSGEVIHAGVPIRTTRYEIAVALGCQGVQACSHEDFPGIAPRPRDTTYSEGAVYGMSFAEGIADCLQRWKAQQKALAA